MESYNENLIEPKTKEGVLFDSETDSIEDGIWRPKIFDGYEVSYGGITNDHKKELGLSDGPELKLITKVDRLSGEISREKIRLGRFLITALRKIDPDADAHNLVKTQLAHTSKVVLVDEDFVKKSPQEKIELTLETDGLITNQENVPLCVAGADCSPVAVFDSKNRAVGLFHSGWRGTVGGISIKGIEMMRENFSSDLKDLVVSIGPSIKADDYEVDKKVVSEFIEIFNSDEIEEILKSSKNEGKFLLDVAKAIKIQLVNLGVPEENIQISNMTTTEEGSKFSSARKTEGGVKNIDSNLYIINLPKTT